MSARLPVPQVIVFDRESDPAPALSAKRPSKIDPWWRNPDDGVVLGQERLGAANLGAGFLPLRGRMTRDAIICMWRRHRLIAA